MVQYINGADFGKETITGIIKRLQNAKVEIIECGWLKDFKHKESSYYFHIPPDLKPYILKKDQSVTYVAMIDFDRYDLNLYYSALGGLSPVQYRLSNVK